MSTIYTIYPKPHKHRFLAWYTWVGLVYMAGLTSHTTKQSGIHGYTRKKHLYHPQSHKPCGFGIGGILGRLVFGERSLFYVVALHVIAQPPILPDTVTAAQFLNKIL